MSAINQQQDQDHVQTTQEVKPATKRKLLLFLLPVALIILSLGWTCIWVIFDLILLRIQSEEMKIPYVLLFFLDLILGFILASPAAYIIKYSGQLAPKYRLLSAFLLIILSLAVGEFFIAYYQIFKYLGVFDFALTYYFFFSIIVATSSGMLKLKLILVAFLIIISFSIIGTKQANEEKSLSL